MTDIAPQPAGEPATWTPLPWDTEFFGFAIGSVELDGIDVTTLPAAVEDARQAGIECLYGTMDGTDVERLVPVQRAGFRFLDASTSYDISPSEPAIPCPPGVTVRVATPADFEGLLPLADRLTAWSRYAVDERFGLEAARRLQHSWLERSLDGQGDNYGILVAEDAGEIIAFIGWHMEEHIVVDAVGTTRRGAGAANHLMQIARDRVSGETLHAGSMAIRNIVGQRFMARCQYRISSVEYRFHCWLDEVPEP